MSGGLMNLNYWHFGWKSFELFVLTRGFTSNLEKQLQTKMEQAAWILPIATCATAPLIIPVLYVKAVTSYLSQDVMTHMNLLVHQIYGQLGFFHKKFPPTCWKGLICQCVKKYWKNADNANIHLKLFQLQMVFPSPFILIYFQFLMSHARIY